MVQWRYNILCICRGLYWTFWSLDRRLVAASESTIIERTERRLSVHWVLIGAASFPYQATKEERDAWMKLWLSQGKHE